MWGHTIIRSNGIETVCHHNNPSNDVKHITHMQSVLVKNGNVQKKIFFNNMASLRFKNETVVLRMIYHKRHI